MKRTMIVSVMLMAGVVGLSGCGNQKKVADKVPAIDPANMDISVKPGTDFFRYANGGWMKNNPLKAEYARYGIFDKLANDNLEQLRTIFDEAAKMDQKKGGIPQKITTMYNMGMDSVVLNKHGAEPIREELAKIAAVADKAELSKMTALMHRQGMFPYFMTIVDADEKNSDMSIVMLYQGGIGMGDRDYYLGGDENARTMKEAYKKYVEKVFTLAGYSAEESLKAANAVIKIEDKLAKASYSREVLRDSNKNYNKMSVKEWNTSNGMMDWNIFFSSMGLPLDGDIVIKQKDFFNDTAKALNDVTLDEHKWYLQYNLIDEAAPYLSDDFVNANFDFFGRTMTGRQELQPRWKRALSTTDGALTEAVGQLYVQKYFPASSKDKMLELVSNLQQALGQRIDQLEWMGDSTKMRAHEKLASFRVKVGYPDTWRDYSALEIAEDSYWANVLRASRFEMDYMLSQAGKPVDKDKWLMGPQMVNAYYNPTTNEICFPAGILQPPFFNPDADDAVNYGGIGVVIGHEMTHGFDDQGRNYDKDGNLNDWWTAEDAARFKERTDMLVNQFNAIEVAPGVHANGSFTLGENIADQGGLLVSYLAYMNSINGKEQPAPIDGLTSAQRFYISYATLWAQNIRPEEILRLTKIDPHSLGEWRVNATLRNIDDFYTTFGVVDGDDMYLVPEQRVNVW